MGKAFIFVAIVGVILSMLCLVAAFAKMNDPTQDDLEDGRVTKT